jgi:hypothetical protein
MVREININLVSAEGCKINIKGKITLTWTITGGYEFSGFSGSISETGGPKCLNGTMTFSSRPPSSGASPRSNRLHVSVDKTDVAKMSKLAWTGADNSAVAALNASNTNNTLCAVIRTAAVATIRPAK